MLERIREARAKQHIRVGKTDEWGADFVAIALCDAPHVTEKRHSKLVRRMAAAMANANRVKPRPHVGVMGEHQGHHAELPKRRIRKQCIRLRHAQRRRWCAVVAAGCVWHLPHRGEHHNQGRGWVMGRCSVVVGRWNTTGIM